jgi:hypothetical protein
MICWLNYKRKRVRRSRKKRRTLTSISFQRTTMWMMTMVMMRWSQISSKKVWRRDSRGITKIVRWDISYNQYMLTN